MSHKAAKAERRKERMKAYKINLKPYNFLGHVRNEETGAVERRELPYDVKESLATILFSQELKLTIDEAFDAKKLADKIRSHDGSILVDNLEMGKLRRAYGLIKAPGEHELEFFSRIRDAEEVDVAEVEKVKPASK